MITALPQRNWRARGGNVFPLHARSLDEAPSPTPSWPGFLQRPIGGTHPYLLLETVPVVFGKPASAPTAILVVAAGVRASGHREILGAEVTPAMGAEFWLEFLKSLRQRGLAGVQLVTADDHPGLQAALRSVLPATTWQRCLTHFMRQAVDSVPTPARQFATAALRRVFAQPDRESARRATTRIATRVARRNPALAELLRLADPVCLSYYSFPAEHRQQIWSTNAEPLLAALGHQLAKADPVTGRDATLRLVTGILARQDAEWRAAGPYCRPVEPPDARRSEGRAYRQTDLSSARPLLAGVTA